MPLSWLSRTGKLLCSSATVIINLLLLVGYPGLGYRPPVVHAAAHPEVRSERPIGPCLFLAAAGNEELVLHVQRGDHFGFSLGHIGPFSGLGRPSPSRDFLHSPLRASQRPKDRGMHTRTVRRRECRSRCGAEIPPGLTRQLVVTNFGDDGAH